MIVGLVALALIAAPAPCVPNDALSAAERAAAADEAVTRAVDAFANQRFEAATAALDEAQCLEPRPQYLYIRGAIAKEQGQCAAAVEHFDAFLASEVPDEDADAARALRDACIETLGANASVPTPDPEPTPEPVTSIKRHDEAIRESIVPSEPCPGRYRPDTVGVALVSAGAVSALAAVGIGIGAVALRRDAPTRGTLQEHDRAIRTANFLTPSAVVVGLLGGGLIAAGSIRWGRSRARHRAQPVPAHCPQRAPG